MLRGRSQWLVDRFLRARLIRALLAAWLGVATAACDRLVAPTPRDVIGGSAARGEAGGQDGPRRLAIRGAGMPFVTAENLSPDRRLGPEILRPATGAWAGALRIRSSARSAASVPAAVPARRILWDNVNTGHRGFWRMDGAVPVEMLWTAVASPIWQSVGAWDFTGDGEANVLFENTVTGERGYWRMQNDLPQEFISLGTFASRGISSRSETSSATTGLTSSGRISRPVSSSGRRSTEPGYREPACSTLPRSIRSATRRSRSRPSGGSFAVRYSPKRNHERVGSALGY